MVAPVTMKKGRSGLWLVVVCEPADARRLADAVLRDTSTLGVRIREERRIELPRRMLEVATPYGNVRVKAAGRTEHSRRDNTPWVRFALNCLMSGSDSGKGDSDSVGAALAANASAKIPRIRRRPFQRHLARNPNSEDFALPMHCDDGGSHMKK